jgi:hypothetical protein
MNLRTTKPGRSTDGRSHRARRTPASFRRPALFLAVAASGALVVNVLTTGEPAAHAGTTDQPVSVARQLGLAASVSSPSADALPPLQNLTASRSQRPDQQSAALLARTTDPHTLTALAAAGQARQHAIDEAKARAAARAAAAAKAAARRAAAAREAAARAAAAKAAAERRAAAARAAAPAAQAAGSPSTYRGYALQKLGGDQGQFSCLENLWGKESGWNPNAANPSSTAYGIPQFLDSTWASTGIAKTSDGFRQIDAGLIYIDSRYGSPCGAWAHSQSYNWY